MGKRDRIKLYINEGVFIIKTLKKEPVYVLLCYILWGILPVFWKMLNSVNSVYVLASRIVWSLLFCYIIVLVKGEFHIIRNIFHSKKEALLLLACSITVTINWGFYIFAVNSGNIIECSLAYYMNPILAIILGIFIFHERLDKIQWFAVLMAIIGVIVPVIYYGKMPYLALIIGGSFAVYGALKKKVAVKSEISIFMETMFAAPVAVIFIVYSEIHGTGCIGNIDASKYYLFPLAGAVTSIPLLLFATGIKKTSMTLSGIFMYVNPTLQLLIGLLIYKERFNNTTLITFGFVILALLLFAADNFRKKPVCDDYSENSLQKDEVV